MDISGKAPLMFYSFPVANDTEISYSNCLGGEQKLGERLWAFRLELSFVRTCMYVRLCALALHESLQMQERACCLSAV